MLLNVLFPDWLLTFLLTALLLWLTARIALKARRLFKVRGSRRTIRQPPSARTFLRLRCDAAGFDDG